MASTMPSGTALSITIAAAVALVVQVGAVARAQTASTGTTRTIAPALGKAFQRGTDDYLAPSGNRGYDVQDYRVALRYDATAHGIRSATVAVTARAVESLSGFSLDAKRGIQVSRVRVNGRAAKFRQRDNKLIVAGFRPLRAGDTFITRIRYKARPQPLKDRSGRGQYGWLRTPGGSVTYSEPDGTSTWVPSNDIFYDKATWSVEIITPAPLLGVSTGIPVRIDKPKRGLVRSVWRMNVPIQSYAQVVAIDRFRYRRGAIAGIPSFTAVAKSASVSVETMVRRTREAVNWLRARLGDYPFPSTGAIVVSGGDSAMETAGRPTYSPESYYVTRATVVHEQAHQWFGNRMTARGEKDLWLHEGFATYLENVFTAQRARQSLDDIVHGQYVIDGWDSGYYGQFGKVTLDDPTPRYALNTTTYFRGQAAVHALRADLGDAAFWSVLRQLGSEPAGRTTTTDEVVARIAALTGKDVSGWANAWVRSKGYQRLPIDPSRVQVLREIGPALLGAAANWSWSRKGSVRRGIRKAVTSFAPMNHVAIDRTRRARVNRQTRWFVDFHTKKSSLYPRDYRSCLVFDPNGPGILRAAWLAELSISANYRVNSLTPAPCP